MIAVQVAALRWGGCNCGEEGAGGRGMDAGLPSPGAASAPLLRSARAGRFCLTTARLNVEAS